MNVSRRDPRAVFATLCIIGTLLSIASPTLCFTSHPQVRSLRYSTGISSQDGVVLPPQLKDISSFSKPCHHLRYSLPSAPTTRLYASKNEQVPSPTDAMIPVDTKVPFSIKTAFTLVAGQSSLIAVAAAIAAFLGTPNYGLGPNIDLSSIAIRDGILWTAPIGVLALLLDKVEEKVPALKDVTKATQASVLGFMGGTFRPIFGFLTAAGLGLAAGVGEEMLFRGVMQYELASRVGDGLALGATSIIFGALHAVTPLYALLAGLASLFFGWLYSSTGNLAIAIACHAFYDLVALMYAHWEVSRMTEEEQEALRNWPLL
ncbi:MAG: hypothetical protein SGILL_010069 [Bacillariaceae sp.]